MLGSSFPVSEPPTGFSGGGDPRICTSSRQLGLSFERSATDIEAPRCLRPFEPFELLIRYADMMFREHTRFAVIPPMNIPDSMLNACQC